MSNYHYEGYYHEENTAEERNSRISGQPARAAMKMKSFDAVVFDLLKVTPDMFARQLTLLDFPIFCKIKPEEISSCGWTKKEKNKLSPNVVAMTRRFNHTSFWVIREILHASTLKIRAERLIHFIRIAKKLVELNNLHSLMAVVQSLTSSSIHRLTQTWALVPKHHKSTFDRMHALVREDDNRKVLRDHMSTIRLPCIPYLGMYLSDVMFINSAHPDTGGLESHERANKMNNILRVVSEFQQSDYRDLEEIPHIKNYLNSVKYIEELQRFLEEDNYKLSLRIEPVSTPHADGSQRRDESNHASRMNKSGGNHHGPQPTSPRSRSFVPGHRKSRSLGKEFYCNSSGGKNQQNVKIQKRQSLGAKEKKVKTWSSPSHHQAATSSNTSGGHNSHHHHHGNASSHGSNSTCSGSLPRDTLAPPPPAVSLLDDSIIHNTSSSYHTNTNHHHNVIGSSRSNSGSEQSDHDDSITWTTERNLDASTSSSQPSSNTKHCQFEGLLKRKCVLKRGRRPSMNPWTRYWAMLRNGQLYLFSSKSLSTGNERHHFKTTTSKILKITGWMVLHNKHQQPHKSTKSSNGDSFQLSNPDNGTMYRFHCDSVDVCKVWVSTLQEGVKEKSRPERDLIDLGSDR